MAQLRYLLVIIFKSPPYFLKKKVEDIGEDFATKKEALSYRGIIDDTVSQAWIYDKVTDKIEWLKTK